MTEKELELLVLVDIETTGLNDVFNDDVVCEVGLRVVDLDLNVVGQWTSLVDNEGWRAKMARNPFVHNMHTKSGLIADLESLDGVPRHPGEYTPPVVALKAYQWLTGEMGLEENTIPAMGSSVQFDREFLHREMIVLNSFFTYRNIDVSTLKELCSRFNPELYKAIKEGFKKSDAKHRVQDDIDATLAEFRIYLDNFLFIPRYAISNGDFAEDETQPVLPGLEEFGRGQYTSGMSIVEDGVEKIVPFNNLK